VTVTTEVIGHEEPVLSARKDPWKRLRWVPLALTLVMQAVFTGRLVALGFASTDEARYITAGHQLIHEFWAGGGSPYYETYFSGAPDIYSPLAAMADRLGGLAEVRLMSLAFMLTATVLLFLTTRRLHGYWPAVISVAIFAGLGTTQMVGRNTIYDALAFTFVAFSAYCASKTNDGARWLIALPLSLLAANATKYMTIAFDPIVVGIAGCMAGDWRQSLRRALALGFTTGTLLILALILAGGAYLQGIMFTTFARQKGADVILGAVHLPGHAIVSRSWDWIGITLALAVIAVVLAAWLPNERRNLPILGLCLLAGIVVTVEAIRLHSSESMHRHDDLSAWFACIPSGYLLALPARSRSLTAKSAAVILGAGAAALTWVHYSVLPSNFTAQPGFDTANVAHEDPLFTALRPYVMDTNRNYLIDGLNNFALFYRDYIGIPWYHSYDDNYIKYPIPGRGGDFHGQRPGKVCHALRGGCMYLEGAAGFRAAIHAHLFAVVSLTRSPSHTLPTDHPIEEAVEHTHGYVLLTHLGGGSTWIYLPDYLQYLSHLR
jgi:hypothetical protein